MVTLKGVIDMWDEKYPDFPIISVIGREEYKKQVKSSSNGKITELISQDGKIIEFKKDGIFKNRYAKTSLSKTISDDKAHAICYTFVEDNDKFTVLFEKLPEYNGADTNKLYELCNQFKDKKIKGYSLSLWQDSKGKGVVKLMLDIPKKNKVVTEDFIVDCMKELISETQESLSSICK